NCSCYTTKLCTQKTYIDGKQLFHISGILSGCSIVEALLQSNLACLYNQSCINYVQYALNSSLTMNVTALDPNTSSQYTPTTTLFSIVSQLMIEKLTNITSHMNYYNQCYPKTCTYTYVGKTSWFALITIIVGVVKSISIVLKFAVYHIVNFIRSFRRPKPPEQHRVTQPLATWCRLANSSLTTDRATFSATQFTTNKVLHVDFFNEQVRSLVNLFTMSTMNTFSQTLAVVNQIMHINGLYSILSTESSFTIRHRNESLRLFQGIHRYGGRHCSCQFTTACTVSLLELTGSLFDIPGLRTGCYISEAALQSTLHCYYNQTCLTDVHKSLGPTTEFNSTILRSELDIKFNATSLISTIVSHMMIDNWTYTASHESFYNQCKPSSCVYSYETKNSLFDVVIGFIALIGGLMMILKFIIPLIVIKLRKRVSNHEQTINEVSALSRLERIHRLWNDIKHWMQTFTMFYSTSQLNVSRTHEVRNNIIATRVCIVLLALSLCGFFFYTSQISILKVVHTKEPSYEKYLELDRRFHQTLSCPCTHISNRYDKFMQLKVAKYHEVCQSIYVTFDWLWLLVQSVPENVSITPDDFRVSGVNWFQALGFFCNLSRTTITEELIRFNSRTFVTSHVLTLDLFKQQSQNLIDSFMFSMTNSVSRAMQIIRDIIQSNALTSSRSTNVLINLNITDDHGIFLEFSFKKIMNHLSQKSCSCKRTPLCVEVLNVYSINSTGIQLPPKLFTVPGVLSGCLIVEALLQSNLVCFYNQSCIN
ncbi:unnamed protein product, partial [Adineta ricciae]